MRKNDVRRDVLCSCSDGCSPFRVRIYNQNLGGHVLCPHCRKFWLLKGSFLCDLSPEPLEEGFWALREVVGLTWPEWLEQFKNIRNLIPQSREWIDLRASLIGWRRPIQSWDEVAEGSEIACLFSGGNAVTYTWEKGRVCWSEGTHDPCNLKNEGHLVWALGVLSEPRDGDKILVEGGGAREISSLKIESLPLKTRTKNVLESAGINTVQELVSFTRMGLHRKNNTGRLMLNEIEACLASLGLKLKGEPRILPLSQIEGLANQLKILTPDQYEQVLKLSPR